MQTMLSSRALATAIVLALAAGAAQAATVFSEDFQIWHNPVTDLDAVRCQGAGGQGTYPFPSGWLLRNVDNRTPATAVAYVNDAWEVQQDLNFNTNNCAIFSTSWYSPAGGGQRLGLDARHYRARGRRRAELECRHLRSQLSRRV